LTTITARLLPAILLGSTAWIAGPVRPASSGAGPGPVFRITPRAPGLAPGDHAFELHFKGLLRRYIVHVPPDTGDAGLPVMLALHGGGGSGAEFKRDNGLDPVADANHFLAVYPDGTGPLRSTLLTWNAGTNCCGWAQTHHIDDVGFLLAVLDDLGRRAAIDRHRIYVTGHSNGAIMAYRFAAEEADAVAAIVPVSGAMAVASFHPSRPVAILDIHSVDDPRALYTGGWGPPFPGTNSRVLHQPVMQGLAQWATNNGCAPEPDSVGTIVGSGPNAGQSVTELRFRDCREGGEIEHLRLRGVGHGWPGSTVRPALRQLLGPGTTLINASDEAWRFASRFRR
jgi:polyhydroxybutyrate depolymerase